MTRIDIPADIDAVFRTVVGEARGCRYEDMLGVAYAIRERALRPGWWGRDYPGVAMNPSQFSCWGAKDPNRVHCLDPFDVEQRAWRRCLSAAMAAVNGDDQEAPVRLYGGYGWGENGALCYLIPTHYIDRSIPLPDWASAEGVIELPAQAWPSAFRWFAQVPGNPSRAKP